MTKLEEFIEAARRCYYQYTRSARRKAAWRRQLISEMIGLRAQGYKVWRRQSEGKRYCPSGWEVIGSGYYGVALVHSLYPEYVLKISGRAGWGDNCRYVNADSRLDAWPVFAEHCKNNPSLHLPEILHLERVSESMTWAVMPRYVAAGDMYSSFNNVEIRAIRRMLQGEEPCSLAWLWPLRQMANGLYIQVDLHGGNVMYNPKTGTFVIIDPFSTTGPSRGSYA